MVNSFSSLHLSFSCFFVFVIFSLLACLCHCCFLRSIVTPASHSCKTNASVSAIASVSWTDSVSLMCKRNAKRKKKELWQLQYDLYVKRLVKCFCFKGSRKIHTYTIPFSVQLQVMRNTHKEFQTNGLNARNGIQLLFSML